MHTSGDIGSCARDTAPGIPDPGRPAGLALSTASSSAAQVFLFLFLFFNFFIYLTSYLFFFCFSSLGLPYPPPPTLPLPTTKIDDGPLSMSLLFFFFFLGETEDDIEGFARGLPPTACVCRSQALPREETRYLHVPRQNRIEQFGIS